MHCKVTVNSCPVLNMVLHVNPTAEMSTSLHLDPGKGRSSSLLTGKENRHTDTTCFSVVVQITNATAVLGQVLPHGFGQHLLFQV